jgi:hypothetical protein
VQAKGLMTSDVDEASLAVCADSDRADKARVCVPGSVEQVSRRRLHFFSTIIHAIDHTRGRRRADCDGFDIVLAHATPATVTGMPKAKARARDHRAWSPAGAAGMPAPRCASAPTAAARHLTMLRFARLVDGVAEVRTGGSLLADSDPVREEQETRLKAETLFRVLAGQSPRPAAAPAAAPQPHTVAFDDGGDPLGPLLAEALVQAGCRFARRPRCVCWAMGPMLPAGPANPLLAINGAGLACWRATARWCAALATPAVRPQPGLFAPHRAARWPRWVTSTSACTPRSGCCPRRCRLAGPWPRWARTAAWWLPSTRSAARPCCCAGPTACCRCAMQPDSGPCPPCWTGWLHPRPDPVPTARRSTASPDQPWRPP